MKNGLNESTVATIENVAKADPATTPEILQALRKACRATQIKTKLLNAREAMELLDVSRPTLRKLTLSGKLHEIKLTPRKTRFDADEVNALAYGLEA